MGEQNKHKAMSETSSSTKSLPVGSVWGDIGSFFGDIFKAIADFFGGIFGSLFGGWGWIILVVFGVLLLLALYFRFVRRPNFSRRAGSSYAFYPPPSAFIR